MGIKTLQDFALVLLPKVLGGLVIFSQLEAYYRLSKAAA